MNEYESIKHEIIKRYGEKSYYQKLEEFFKFAQEHRMDLVLSTELDMPIYAKLRFEPLLCWREDQELSDKIREAIKES